MTVGPEPVVSWQQIDELELDTNRPLLLCDVDEVVVHFLRGLERWLNANGMWLDPASFALNGNIRRTGDDSPIEGREVGKALMSFFEDETHRLDVIEGATDALKQLSDVADVVMLTNLPEQFRAARIANLQSHGLEFPVVTNSGPKGPAVAALAQHHVAPVVFVDDNNGYLKSAADHLPDATIVHFMQDARFGRHVEQEVHVHFRTDNWPDAHDYIQSALTSCTQSLSS